MGWQIIPEPEGYKNKDALLLGFRRKGDAERRCWRMTSVTSNLEAKFGLKTSVNYCGADPQRAFKVNNNILKTTLFHR